MQRGPHAVLSDSGAASTRGLLAARSPLSMVTVIASFLPADDFRRLQQMTRPRRGGRDVYGKLKDMAFLAATRRCIAARVTAAADLSIQ